MNKKTAASKKFREKNPEYNKVYSKNYRNKYPVKTAIRHMKSDAKKSNREYSLPEKLAIDLLTDNCFYCGVAPLPRNGIDRVDPNKGYVEDNVVTACWQCNSAKNKYSRKEFECWVLKVASHICNSSEEAK